MNDPRDYQIIFLLAFLFLGIGTRDWSIHPEYIATLVITCCVTQCLAVLLFKPIANQEDSTVKKGWLFPQHFDYLGIKSALITSLGLSLLLRAENQTTMIIAGILAITSKFLFRWNEKHFFNPANFGIIMALLLSNDAWVSPGQWGTDWWYVLLFLGTGGIVLRFVGRGDTSLTFLGVYSLLEAGRNIWLGWTWDVFTHRLMSGSLLLFALFMITDPRSIPNHRIGRISWAIAIAILTFILRNYFYINTAVFWALFILSPVTIAIDYFQVAPQFKWSKINPLKLSLNQTAKLS